MIERRAFGRSGHQSSRVIFGGAALGEADGERAAAAFGQLRCYGVNHIDSSVSYGTADKRIGEQISGERELWFLAGKVDARGQDAAAGELERSLADMGTDYLDLLQMHELVRKEDVDRFLDGDGAAGVLMKARETGKARQIGVTGHGWEAPGLLLRCVQALSLDSVLLPWNYVLSRDPDYREAFEELREACRSRGIAVQTIKSIARSSWDGVPRTRTTWYRPLEEQADIDRAVWWVLAQEDLFLCSAGDTDLLTRVLDAADRYSGPPAEEEMAAMADRLGMVMPGSRGWPRLWQA